MVPGTRSSALATWAVWFAAALSGGAALSYELAWSRALVVPLGNSMDAAAVVLAGFMLGIAGGALAGGRLSERVRSPLRAYALLEALLGVFAFGAPLALRALAHVGAGPAHLGVAMRYVLALLLIALPCMPMGASLPLLVKALTRPGIGLGRHIGIVYGANTAGAAAGACLTGFWGIALLGGWKTSALSGLASLGAAAIVLAASRWLSQSSPDPAAADQVATTKAYSAHARRAALAAAFVSGLSMLACELLWTRVLTFVFGHDTYAFAALLTIVLMGLAVGGLLHRPLAGANQTAVLGAALGAFSVSTLGSFWLAGTLVVRAGRDPFGLDASGNLATSAWLELIRELAFTPLLLLLPTVFSGLMLPAACSVYGQGAKDPGRRVGVVFLVNGVGSAVGALVGAFGLVSLAGIQGGLLAVALFTAAAAGPALLLCRRTRGLTDGLLAATPIGAAIVVYALMPHALPRQMLLAAAGARHQTLLYYEEGRTGSVSVLENQIHGEKQLWVNAVNEVTTRLVHDQSFKMLGHLGPLLHPTPRSAVMICLGAGLSAGAAMTHPLERLDVVDLSQSVARAARHFERENNHVLDDPRFHLHVDDGRQFLLNRKEPYDLAIIDSTHPKAVDSWILYTREFYELVHSRLALGGVLVQWLPLHGLSENEFKIVVRTFQSAFPEMTLWANGGVELYGNVAYAKLVGVKQQRLRIDYDRLVERLHDSKIGGDLAPFGMDSPEEVLDAFLAGPESLARWTEGLPVQTDDHPVVPYTTAFSRGRRMEPRLLLGARDELMPWLHSASGAHERDRKRLETAREAHGLVLGGALSRAAELRPEGAKLRLFLAQAAQTRGYYAALAERYSEDVNRLFEAGTQLGALGYPDAARGLYEQALRVRPKDFRVRLHLALLNLAAGDHARAVALLAELRTEAPRSALVHHNLGAALLAAGDPGVAAAHLREALAWDPDALGAQLALGEAYIALGDDKRARQTLAALVERNPWIAEAHDRMGLLAMRAAAWEPAVAYFQRATALDPVQPAFRVNLGDAWRAQGAWLPADQAYRQALRLRPRHAPTLVRLGQLKAAQDHHDEAIELFVEALDAAPGLATAAYGLGVSLHALGRADEAVHAHCLALRLAPGLEASLRALEQLGVKPAACPR